MLTMKSTFAKLLASVVVLFALMFGWQMAAPSSAQAAEEINANTWYVDTLYGEQTKTVTYTMPAKGIYHVEYRVSGCWELDDSYSYSCSGVTCKMMAGGKSFYYEVLPHVGQTYKSQDFAFKKGKTLKVVFRGGYGEENRVRYRVVLDKKSLCEIESNNTMKQATHIKANKEYLATLHDYSDKDWFVFIAPKSGKIKIQVKATRADYDNASITFNGYWGNTDSVTVGGGWRTVSSGHIDKGTHATFYMDTWSDWISYRVRVMYV